VLLDARCRRRSGDRQLPIHPGRPTTNFVAALQEPHRIRACGEDVVAFRAFTGKGYTRLTSGIGKRYADALTGAGGAIASEESLAIPRSGSL
jgi:hypothetical protein